MNSQHWDIFCRVIDNYGDIGVCWRLARQLAHEHRLAVRLWVDDLEALVRIWPEAVNTDQQQIAGVEIRRWHANFPHDIQAAEVVIEAFACEIPPSYLHTMKQGKRPPLWINLDYLSAEAWVEGCHTLPSIHPSSGLQKTFFFPGFTPRTGGLLREKDLLIEQQQFNAREWLAAQGIYPYPEAQLISLFAYENAALAELIQAWAESSVPIYCCVPAGRIVQGIYQHLGKSFPGSNAVGDIHTFNRLSLHILPFLNQREYDYLLWSCDLNFVRGEDSFVRAQWAGKPFVWQIYPQDEDAHLIKLDAFLARYLPNADALMQANIHTLWHSWNQQSGVAQSWQQCWTQLEQWLQHGQNWRAQLSQQTDLAQQLVLFCQQGTTETR